MEIEDTFNSAARNSYQNSLIEFVRSYQYKINGTIGIEYACPSYEQIAQKAWEYVIEKGSNEASPIELSGYKTVGVEEIKIVAKDEREYMLAMGYEVDEKSEEGNWSDEAGDEWYDQLADA